MKHLLTLRVALIACISMLLGGGRAAAQETETIDLTTGFSDQEEVSQVLGTDVTLDFTKGTAAPKYYSNGTAVRIYKGGGSMRVSSDKTMTAISIIFDDKTASNVSAGGYSGSESLGTWIGESKSVTFTASNTTRIQKVTVTFAPKAGAVSSPAITPTTGTKFVGSQEITITSADGTTVWYTVDGTDPAVGEGTSIEYTAPFTIDATTTVKAIATDGTNVSSVVSAEYTKVEVIDGVSKLVEKIKADNNAAVTEYYVNLTGAVVTGVYSKYAYIEEDGMAVYLNQSGHALKIGQKYSGLATVSAKMNYGLPQLTAFACENVVESATLPLEIVTLADLTADYDTYLYRRVKVEDVTVAEAFVNQNGSVSQSEVSMNVYAQGGSDITMAVNDVIDMVAFPNIYSSNQQLNVLAQEDITVKTAAPVFYFSTNAVSVRIDGGDVEEPVLTNTYGEAPEYSSSNTDVATVDASTGEVTIVSEGETTITATLASAGKEVSYTLTVTGIPVKTDGNYYLVTSTNDLVVGGRYLIANNSAGKVMGWQDKNNRRISTKLTWSDDKTEISEVTLATEKASADDGKAREFVLETGNKAGTWAFYDAVEDGYLYAASSGSNYLRTQTTLNDDNGSATIDIASSGDATVVFQGENTRNAMRFNSTLFSCYNPTSSSVSDLVELYKLYTINQGEFTIGTDGYATFYTDKAFVMPKSVTGGIITEAVGNKLTIAYNYPAGSTVPAGTALLLKGVAGKYAYDCTTSEESAPVGNLLHGADAVDADGKTSVAGIDVKYYVLSKKNGANIGFYWAEENGAPIKYQEGKAFLAVDAASGAREFFCLEDIETCIDGVEATQSGNGKIYTVTGVYVGTNQKALPKGIYVVNGKKVAF